MKRKIYRATIETDTQENLDELELRFYVMCKALGIKVVDNTTGSEIKLKGKEDIDKLADVIKGK